MCIRDRAQPAQHLHQPPADLPGADHPIGAFGQVGAAHLGHCLLYTSRRLKAAQAQAADAAVEPA